MGALLMSRQVEKNIRTPITNMSHTRQSNTPISVDDVREWKMHMEQHSPRGLNDFEMARGVIVKRKEQLCGVVAKQLAIAYKSGDPFPSHFVWGWIGYELVQPDALSEATKRQHKSKDFLEGFCRGIVADHEWDRFVTLVIGLTTAGKIVTHWSELEEDE